MITEGSVSPKEKEQWINDCYGAANRLLIIIEGILEANTFEGRTPAFDFKLYDLEQTNPRAKTRVRVLLLLCLWRRRFNYGQ